MSIRQWALLAITWAAVLLVGAWAYQPGLAGPDLLDDAANLARLETLVESPGQWAEVVFGNHSGPLGRPVSMASFALEKLYADHGLYGMKRTNLALHCVTASLLLLWLLSLLRYTRSPLALPAALLAAAAWLLAPLYVSTVLYPVQRMAQLSALFSLLACLLFTVGRSRQLGHKLSWPYLCLVPVAIVLATLAKENGALSLVLVLAIEVALFRGRAYTWIVTTARGRMTASAALVLAAPATIWLLLRLLGGYKHRDFTLLERLLTQARILWDYIGQLLWPRLSGMGVSHDDYMLSSGLMTPPSTLLAVVGWVVVIGVAVQCHRKGRAPLLVLGVAFFCIAHAVESTVLPLELYFEHRNYLPGAGVLLVLVAIGCALAQRFSESAWPLALLCTGVVLRSAGLLGAQAVLWSSAPLITLEAVSSHPESPRAVMDYALLLSDYGDLDRAVVVAESADALLPPAGETQVRLRTLIFTCRANRDAPADILSGLHYRTTDLSDVTTFNTLNSLLVLMESEACPAVGRSALAEALFGALSETASVPVEMLLVLANYENHLQRFGPADHYVQRLLQQEPEHVTGLMMGVYFAGQLGHTERAEAMLDRLKTLDADGALSNRERENLNVFLGNKEGDS